MDVDPVAAQRVREERRDEPGVASGRNDAVRRDLPFADVEYRAAAAVCAHRVANDLHVDGDAAVRRRKVSYEQYFRTGGRHGGAGGSCAAADCPASGWQRCYAPTARPPPPGRYSPVKGTEAGRETAAQKRDSSSARSDGCASSAAACCAAAP